MAYTPEMGPQIAYLFLPVIFLIIAVPVIALEAILRRISKPRSARESFVNGVWHATWLVWWAFPDHWWLIVAINPLALRLLDRFLRDRTR